MTRFDHLFIGRSLSDLLQQVWITGFDAHVHNSQPEGAQDFQILNRLPQDVFGICVDADPFNRWEKLDDRFQDFNQSPLRNAQRVTVREKDPRHGPHATRVFQILPDLFNAPNGKPLFKITSAKGAPVVITPERSLDNQAVGFAGWTINSAYIVDHLCLSIVFVTISTIPLQFVLLLYQRQVECPSKTGTHRRADH
jgi:hypothetical protein